MYGRRLLLPFNVLIFLCLTALLAMGILFVRSASSSVNSAGEITYAAFAHKQVIWISLACIACAVVAWVPYRTLTYAGYAFYVAVLLALVYVLFFGRELNGVRRWIDLGVLRVQPSEFMKIALILALAKHIDSQRGAQRTVLGLLTLCGIVLVPMVLIAKEPDLGTALMLIPIFVAIIHAAGVKLKHIALMGALGTGLFLCFFLLKMNPYQRDRIVSLLKQSSRDDRIRLHEVYHTDQSKVAIGSGGFWGKGWGQGTQNRGGFLPEKHNDFIFAVVAEEWGFAGATLLLGLYVALFGCFLAVGEATKESRGRVIVVGVSAMLSSQVLVNLSMTLGLMPIVGLTLPFVSYGGSSMLTSMIALALVVNVARRPLIVFRDEFEFRSED